MFRFFITACLLALPTISPAQEVNFSPSYTNDCTRNGGGVECIGTSANQCMDDSASGYSTVGMNACLDRELQMWDGELNRVYRQLMQREEEFDAEEAKFSPDRPSGAEALRQAQRAWIAYRDGICNFEVLQWYGGTGASGAYLSCMMRLTGQQAIYLTDMLGSG